MDPQKTRGTRLFDAYVSTGISEDCDQRMFQNPRISFRYTDNDIFQIRRNILNKKSGEWNCQEIRKYLNLQRFRMSSRKCHADRSRRSRCAMPQPCRYPEKNGPSYRYAGSGKSNRPLPAAYGAGSRSGYGLSLRRAER